MEFNNNPVLQQSLNVLMNHINDVVIVTDIDQKIIWVSVVAF